MLPLIMEANMALTSDNEILYKCSVTSSNLWVPRNAEQASPMNYLRSV